MALLHALLGSQCNVEKEMQTLTKNELSVLDKAQPDYILNLVETESEGSRWWLMKVILPTQEKEYKVVTQRGKIKLWKQIDVAVDFVKETCQQTTTLIVIFK